MKKAPTRGKVIFLDGKVGRHTGVEDLEITDPERPDSVMLQVLRYVKRRRLLATTHPDVWLDDDLNGGIDAGFRTVAEFRVEVADSAG